MMKRTIIGWLFMCFAIAVSAQNLKFKDGKFKIIQFTDLHYKLEILHLVRQPIAFMRL